MLNLQKKLFFPPPLKRAIVQVPDDNKTSINNTVSIRNNYPEHILR